MPVLDDGRLDRLDGAIDDRPHVHSFHVQRDRAARDARDIEQVVDELGQVDHLPLDHVARPRHRRRILQCPRHYLDRVPYRCQRVAQLVREYREEFVLAAVRLLERESLDRGHDLVECIGHLTREANLVAREPHGEIAVANRLECPQQFLEVDLRFARGRSLAGTRVTAANRFFDSHRVCPSTLWSLCLRRSQVGSARALCVYWLVAEATRRHCRTRSRAQRARIPTSECGDGFADAVKLADTSAKKNPRRRESAGVERGGSGGWGPNRRLTEALLRTSMLRSRGPEDCRRLAPVIVGPRLHRRRRRSP